MSSSVPTREDLAALGARARSDIHHDVGGAHRIFVVFDDDQRVTEIAQRLQRREQTIVVALMQPDRRLVEDVEHADERAADLRRQANALRLAAGERRGRTRERQIVQADVASGSPAARESP